MTPELVASIAGPVILLVGMILKHLQDMAELRVTREAATQAAKKTEEIAHKLDNGIVTKMDSIETKVDALKEGC